MLECQRSTTTKVRTREGWTDPEDFNLTLDLGHAQGGVDSASSDELDGDLLAPLTVQTQLDLAKLALAKRLQKEIRSEFGYGSAGVGGSIGYGGWVRVDVVVARGVVGLLLLLLGMVGVVL